MLNNSTNYPNLIRIKAIADVPQDTDLITLGVRNLDYDGNYRPALITYRDFADSILAQALPLINYSNVVFVDPIFGNNNTALIGRFDKPYVSISEAKYAIAGSTTLSTINRALVYIRKGTYLTDQFYLDSSFVDYYCEPGVVFTGGTGYFTVTDTNWYGHAVFTGNSLVRTFNTGVVGSTFEFEKADVTSQFILMDNNTSGYLNVKCTSIKTGVNPVLQFAISLRGSANYTFNVSDFIEGGNQIFGVRFASGRIVINCPKIIIDDMNVFSTNTKGAFAFYENSGVDVVVNSNIYSNETVYRGGTSGAVLFWQGGLQTFTLNGNIYGGFSLGLNNGQANSNSKMIVNGSITSRTQAVYGANPSTIVVKDGFVQGPVELEGALVRLFNGAKAFFINVGFKHNNIDKNIIAVENAAVNLNLQNCLGQSNGSAGNFINSTVPVNVRIHNTRANKTLNANVTDVLTPSGFISDAETQVFNF
jgi:hypothetical protein